MELEVNETGAANVELSGAYEPPKAAFASTSRKVPGNFMCGVVSILIYHDVFDMEINESQETCS